LYNITCTDVKNSSSFLSFIDTVDSVEEALNTIDPVLVNNFVDSLRSMVGKEQEARITPDRVLNLMFPNPNATFDFSGLLDFNMTGGSRALTLYEPFSSPESFLPILDRHHSSRALWSSECITAFWGVMLQIILIIFAASGLFSQKGAIAARDAIVKAAGGKAYLDQMITFIYVPFRAVIDALAKPNTSPMEKIRIALFVIRCFSHFANFLGLKLMLKAYFKSVGVAGTIIQGATVLLSLAALCLTDGASLAAQILHALVTAGNLITAGLNCYDKCYKEWCERSRELIDCDDGKMCTIDQAICTSNGLECRYMPIMCLEGLSCDQSDGVCKPKDEVVPCVAVIDEDDNFGVYGQDQATLWSEFRAVYPVRPFCLLAPSDGGNLRVPQNFLDDDYAIVKYDIRRDYGDPSLAEDWYKLCAIDQYNPAMADSVGLFVDNSGSMMLEEVQASYDLFVSNVENAGIKVREVVDGNENWILPFMTTLVPAPICMADGKP
jgi:hypothetical protein